MIYSDLAMETRAGCGKIPGICVEQEKAEGRTVTRVTVENKDAATFIGKPVGTYVTIEEKGLTNLESCEREAFSKALSAEMRALFENKSFSSVLIAGIGNRNLTPDALGPRCVEGILVTGHLRDADGCKTFVLNPGVTGQTGIETKGLLASVIGTVRPDLVILVDALCARATDRILSTVQLTNAGVVPGSGLGNRRCALNKETLGIPVLAVGVPTVVHASTIIEDALESRSIENIELTDLLEEEKLVVTPADIDESLQICAEVIAHAINLWLHPDFSEAQA